MSTAHLGIWLVTLGFLTRRQLTQALETEVATGVPLSDVLSDQQYLKEAEVQGAFSFQQELARVSSLQDLYFDLDVLALVPLGLATREKVLPLRQVGQRLIVGYSRARARPEDVTRIFDQIGELCGLLVHGLPFPAEELDRAIARAYEPLTAQSLVDRAVQRSVPAAKAAPKVSTEVAGSPETTDAPIVGLVNQILAQAVERGASDLHIRPTDEHVEVKMRLDGVMQPLMMLPREVEASLIGRLKILANLDIAERRRPQDGRFSIQVDGRPIDLRVASIATHFGETMVLRLLRPLSLPDGLAGLGFQAQDLERWQRIVQAPNGLILVTGPTGSGKTSTLYATLAQFDRRIKNLVTVEDPVEYPVPGVGQIQVAPKAGLTFAAALRSILRLDPDVILVGEIRDHETLEIALEAAQTGHLVLSTLHTNDAVSAISRMAEMGAPRHQIAATLVGVLAQRLVRRNCAQCTRPAPAEPDEHAFLHVGAHEPLTLMSGVGCDACGGIGYRGRQGVYEVLEMNADLADGVNAGWSTQELWRRARDLGMSTLLTDGKAKIRRGDTTVAEVQRVVGLRERGD